MPDGTGMNCDCDRDLVQGPGTTGNWHRELGNLRLRTGNRYHTGSAAGGLLGERSSQQDALDQNEVQAQAQAQAQAQVEHVYRPKKRANQIQQNMTGTPMHYNKKQENCSRMDSFENGRVLHQLQYI